MVLPGQVHLSLLESHVHPLLHLHQLVQEALLHPDRHLFQKFQGYQEYQEDLEIHVLQLDQEDLSRHLVQKVLEVLEHLPIHPYQHPPEDQVDLVDQ